MWSKVGNPKFYILSLIKVDKFTNIFTYIEDLFKIL